MTHSQFVPTTGHSTNSALLVVATCPWLSSSALSTPFQFSSQKTGECFKISIPLATHIPPKHAGASLQRTVFSACTCE
jgi:hypothetical protein